MAVESALYLRDSIRLTPGRIEWCARSIAKRLRPDEASVLGPIAAAAEEAGRRAYWLYVGRENAKKALFSEVAKTKNAELDHATSGVFNLLALLARIHAAGTEVGAAVRRLQAAFFPHSLKPLTSGAYPDELSGVRRIVALAKGERAADVATTPGLREILAILEARADEFESVLERETSAAPSFAEAEAAAAEAERRMVDLVTAIHFHYRGDEEAAVARRSELLEPYAVQQESLRQRYRRRLPPVDVDPETGEEPADGASTPAARSLVPA